MFFLEIKRILIVVISAVLNAISLNFFLIKANVYASGFTGVAQLLSSVMQDYVGFGITTGVLLFILNIPVIILGWYKVGKGFTIYSIISVVFTTFFLEVIPVKQLSTDILLNSVFGGVIGALGVGLTLKWGASTGGMDIVAMVLSRIKDRPIGTYFFILNGLIIILAGLLYDEEKALYTIVTLYVSTRVIDAVHTRHEKLTAMIITTEAEALQRAIHSKMVRGITTVPARGAFTNQEKDMLIMVITRYELYDLEHTIKDVDPNAFTNIVQTTGIFGFFRRGD
ncbi:MULTISPECIES: YitT family protein [Pontibacillus]|uniref:YitT family protein n=1 Tax=Pontibacillus chungwhensis TaxID=265426 RepID=A0ABY8V061_9BACI|nr:MULTISPECIES: YitT family protein [Pontibacillus]MCD5324717.1 YitT family protein [Pontibacillus sp. HN14]WIF98990.1 YitT family protein [Pontibacillus chungwhensis]